MNSAILLDNFDLLAEAPGGVPKLRELILQLAVRGKLVPQNPRDEPADALLARLRVKHKLARAQGSAGDRRNLGESLPSGWTLAAIRELGEIRGGGTPAMSKSFYWNGTIPWVSPKDMKAEVIEASELAITERATTETAARLIPKGSVLLVGRSGILRRTLPVAVNALDCAVNQDLKAIVPFEPLMAEYIRVLLKGYESLILRDLAKVGMTVESLKYDELFAYPFPLPPLAEQKRIVARVDELMKRCDELEARQKERNERHKVTVSACLHAATDPRKPNPNFIVHPSSFNLLFTSPESVAELRKTILQLAVQGRLVPQEVATDALTLLAELREKKYHIQRICRMSSESPSREILDTLPSLPACWVWCRFDDLIVEGPQNGYSPPKTDVTKGIKALTLSATTKGIFNPSCFKYIDVNPDAIAKFWLRDGDLLFQRGNTPQYVGVAAVYQGSEEEFIYPDLMIRVRVSPLVDLGFVHAALLSPLLRQRLRDEASGTSSSMVKISQSDICALPFPLPPRAEQGRIMAKVNELMTLCDALERNLTQSFADADTLAAAVVHQMSRGMLVSGGVA